MTPVEARNTSCGRHADRLGAHVRPTACRLAAALAGEGVGVAGVDDQHARLAAGQSRPAPVDRRRRALRAGEDAGDLGPLVEDHDQEIGAVLVFDAGFRSGDTDALDRRQLGVGFRRERRNGAHCGHGWRSSAGLRGPAPSRRLRASARSGRSRSAAGGASARFRPWRRRAAADFTWRSTCRAAAGGTVWSLTCSKAGGCFALVLDLDDMPAELRLHRLLGVGADLERERCLLEFRHHLCPVAEPAEIAALRRGAGSLRLLLGDLGEIAALSSCSMIALASSLVFTRM